MSLFITSSALAAAGSPMTDFRLKLRDHAVIADRADARTELHGW
jgi:hypothetical protein